jgi:NCS1 family nucleobase:cation symporter-1
MESSDKMMVDVPAGSYAIPKTKLLGADQVPIETKGKTWGVYALSATWFAMVIAIADFMIFSGSVLAGLSFWQAVLAYTIGTAVVALVFWANGSIGAKYGINHTVQLRLAFGNQAGSYLASAVRAIIALIWFGVNSWVATLAIDSILSSASGWGDLAMWPRWIVIFVAVTVLQALIVWRGYRGVKFLETWGAPILIAVIGACVIWMFRSVGSLGPMFEAGTEYTQWGSLDVFVKSGVMVAIAGWFTIAFNASDFTRVARSNKHVGWTVFLFITLGWIICGFLAVGSMSMSLEQGLGLMWNPVDYFGAFPSAAVALLLLVLVIVSSFTTNPPANIFSPATTLTNFVRGKLKFGQAGAIMVMVSLFTFPWLILARPDTLLAYLNNYGSALGALIGVMLTDWLVFRRRGKLDLAELYEPDGRYKYWKGGINWVAIGSCAVGIPAGFLLLNGTYAVLLSTVVAGAVYLVAMKALQNRSRVVHLATLSQEPGQGKMEAR